eukprot:gnl/Spiro4/2644_TR1281_c0_g1_i1.p1 gnl/Spiro4/2644_TR1281_c0_g1~~gnl/Spiro4/2644_TR1281_c0_g1_i1.p1  ORF type:complete len:184 (+),score=53.19 gnl/Spiro4/2644_TR1281_c0_g1_i1:33-584(+)
MDRVGRFLVVVLMVVFVSSCCCSAASRRRRSVERFCHVKDGDKVYRVFIYSEFVTVDTEKEQLPKRPVPTVPLASPIVCTSDSECTEQRALSYYRADASVGAVVRQRMVGQLPVACGEEFSEEAPSLLDGEDSDDALDEEQLLRLIQDEFDVSADQVSDAHLRSVATVEQADTEAANGEDIDE